MRDKKSPIEYTLKDWIPFRGTAEYEERNGLKENLFKESGQAAYRATVLRSKDVLVAMGGGYALMQLLFH